MAYGAETRADTSKTKRTTQMTTRREIIGNTLLEKKRNEDLRRQTDTSDIERWCRTQRRYWNTHVSRMNEDTLPRIVSENIPTGRRLLGRPSKRWRDSWQSTSQEKNQ